MITYHVNMRGGDNIENWLTIDELASLLKVKKNWLYKQTMRKDRCAIPRIKVGRYLRFDPDAVESWIIGGNSWINKKL